MSFIWALACLPLWNRLCQTRAWDLVLSCWNRVHILFISFQSCFWNANCLLFLPLHSDYIQCPYCMRRFNENAANRHINFCKDQSSRRVFDPAQTAAKLASRGQVNISPQVLDLVLVHAWDKRVEFDGKPKSTHPKKYKDRDSWPLSLILTGRGSFCISNLQHLWVL